MKYSFPGRRSVWVGLRLCALVGTGLVLGACALLNPRPAPLPTPIPQATQTPLPASPTPLPATAVPTFEITPTPTSEPTFSPRLRSGLRVTYVDSQRNLWLWDEGQAPLLLANTADVDRVKISPDGSKIILTRAGDGVRESIWVVNANGSDGKILMDEGKLGSISPVDLSYTVVPFQMNWIKGTYKMALSSRPIFDGMRFELNYDLLILDTDSGKISQIFEKQQAGMFFISPDGKTIALVHPGRIDLMDADGGNLRSGVLNFAQKFNDGEYRAYPRWSSDSQKLRVVVPPDKSGLNAPIWDIPAAVGDPVRVGTISTEALFSATFSPDLSGLVYLRHAGGDVNETFREVHVANGDGSADRILVTGQVSIDEWSPDSSRFIYGESMPSEPRVAGKVGPGSPLTDTKRAEQIRWVDGERVIFFVRNGKNWELRLGKPGEVSRVLVSFPHVKARPSFDFVP